MKQGWEIKKLKDVTSLITDGDWIESRHQSEDGIRLIQIGNIGNGFFKAKDDKPHFISEETFDVLGCTEIFEGDCLVSRLPDPVGRACLIPEMDCRMITAVDCSIIRFNEILVPDFFVYYSQSSKYQNEISNKTTGTTRKRISRKNLEMIPIPVPPIAEQEKIVAELDCLSGIIEKKKQQLKELDNLAQSIFYEMFGDPVENDKRWEVKKIGEVCIVERGGSPRPINAFITDDENGVNWIKIGDATEGSRFITSTKEKIIPEGVRKSRMVYKGDFILSNSMSFGRPYIMGVDGCIHDGWLVLRDKDNVFDKTYLYYYLGSSHVYQEFKRLAVGGVVNNLNSELVRGVRVAIPSFSVQQEFASKIESIEMQKELIAQSIKETETLFNSRMDYYFN